MKSIETLDRNSEKEPTERLFHVSGYPELVNKKPGDIFQLIPGPQGAEGNGVYFSEDEPRFTAAEGAHGKTPTVVVIEVNSKKGWWRSKGAVQRKFNRPRTWHSNQKSISCTVKKVEEKDGIKYLFCDWEWQK